MLLSSFMQLFLSFAKRAVAPGIGRKTRIQSDLSSRLNGTDKTVNDVAKSSGSGKKARGSSQQNSRDF